MTMAKGTSSEVEKTVGRPYSIEIEYGQTPDEGVAAYVAEWPGCITAGSSREEALARIGDAMRDWVEARLRDGLEIPEPMREYGGTVVVKMPRSLHRDAAKRAAREGVSMNQWISTTVARAIGAERTVSDSSGHARSRSRGKAVSATRRAAVGRPSPRRAAGARR